MTLVATGAYQLSDVLRASKRLAERDVPRIYLLEPGRFRVPRVKAEQEHLASAQVRKELFPGNIRTRG